MTKKYYWLKLKTDFFASKEIKKLRRMAGGDTFVIIYLKMQLVSLKNDGKIYFDGIEEDFASEIALMLDEDADNVRLTMAFLQNYGLIEFNKADECFLTEVPEVTGKEGDSARRMRKLRASQSDIDVTECDTEIDIDIEKDTDKDKDSEKKKKADKSAPSPSQIAEIVDLYHKICTSYSKVTVVSDTRKNALKTLMKKFSIEQIKTVFETAEKSDFLKGINNRNWKANFDWFIKESNFVKVLDGNYNNQQKKDNSDGFDASEYEQFLNQF